MRCEIEVDLGELLNEWEPVAFRVPMQGDEWIDAFGDLAIKRSAPAARYPRLIIRRKWTPPAWLKAGWIAMDEDGAWYAYKSEPMPHYDDGEWLSGDEASYLCQSVLDFTPPPCDDWKQSKRKIG